MSNYGPYPDQSQDPWHTGRQPAPGQPVPGQPGYGDEEPRYAPPDYGQAGYTQPGYGQEYGQGYGPETGQGYGPETGQAPPGYADPDDAWGRPAPRRGRAPMILLVAVLAVIVVLGGIAGAYLLTRGSGRSTAGGGATGPAGGNAPTTGAPSAPPSPTVAPNDALTAQVGDCLVNAGTDAQPEMHKVACAANTFQVLKRFDGTVDKTKCNGVPGYTHNYFYDTAGDANDFVLCLQQRK